MVRVLVLSALGMVLAGPVLGAGKFPVPAGCTAIATVQQRNCQVSQHYRCSQDAPGEQWVVMLDSEGPFFASKIDSETRWIESIDLDTGETDRIGAETDPASFTTLLDTGTDTFDFETESSNGEVRRYKGYDRLTGERVMIDGVPLERTEFDLSAYATDGSLIWRRKGRQLIHREWRLFYSDAEDFVNGFGDTVSTVDAPVRFDFPGDTGFLADKPEYDCDMMMTELRP
jgi:hypothetical protein